MRRIQLARDEVLALCVELLLVSGNLLIRSRQLEPRQIPVVKKNMIRLTDLVDHEIRDNVVVTTCAVAQAGLRIKLGDFIGSALHVLRADAEPLR